MKKKKLVFLINDLPFFMSHRLPIALNAVKNGYDVRIFTGQPASVQMYNSYKNINNKFNFPITELNFKSSDLNLFNNFYVFIKILNTFKKINPDILHVVSMKSIILGGMIARLINIKFLVISFSGFGYLFTGKKTFFERILIFLFLFLLKIICKHKNKKIICQNFVDKTFVLKNGLAKNKEIIFIKGSGVDLKLYKKIKYNINNNVVLMPSRLLKNKGVIDFFEAAKIIYENEKGIKWKFIVIGASDYENPSAITSDELNKWTNKYNIEIINHNVDLRSFYSSSGIVCLPSHREGMPKSVIEAAASGIPVVTTDTVGCQESIIPGKTGELANVNDPQDLAVKIMSLISNNKKRMLYSIAAKEFAKKNFDLNSVIEKHMQIYHNSS